jgi:hypothetical protein
MTWNKSAGQLIGIDDEPVSAITFDWAILLTNRTELLDLAMRISGLILIAVFDQVDGSNSILPAVRISYERTNVDRHHHYES